MSDRTFRLILDGKKGGLVKGSTPSSAAKKAYKKLSGETGKSSFKFELQETTKDSKKKVYGPYKASLVKDKIKVKIVGGGLPIPNTPASPLIKVNKNNNPFNVLINHGNDEYQGLLKIKEVAANWNNVEKILEKNNAYSTAKILELKKKLGIKNNNNKSNFFTELNLSKLYEYYKKHKAELKN
jgi:hypothetical protein